MKMITLLRQAQFHGAIRLAETRYRWWWALTLSILFGCSVTVVVVTVNRYMGNPTFLVREETINNTMSFPSVILCPEIMFRDDRIDQFINAINFPYGLNATYIKVVIQQLSAFFAPDVQYRLEDLTNIEQLLHFNNLNIDIAARKLVTSCEETLIRCRWQGTIVNCSLLFQMELTGEGYCCVFNGRSLIREMSEYGVHNKVFGDQWFTSTYGYTSGLALAINQSQKLNNVDLTYKWIAVDESQYFIEAPVNGTPLNPGSEEWTSYSIQGFQIAEFVRTLNPRLRRCRMADQPLKLFPLYHKSYCLVECEVERTIDRCKCARIVHPKPPAVPVCGARSLLCAKHAMVSLCAEDCDCPQACDVAQDTVQTSSFQLMPGVQPFDAFYDGLNFSTVTIVRTFIPNKNVKTKARWSYFSYLDLFAQLGGVFNVFFGVSILSILEIIQLAWRAIRDRNKIPQPRMKLNYNAGKGVKPRMNLNLLMNEWTK